jgi:hypothetical protein
MKQQTFDKALSFLELSDVNVVVYGASVTALWDKRENNAVASLFYPSFKFDSFPVHFHIDSLSFFLSIQSQFF